MLLRLWGWMKRVMDRYLLSRVFSSASGKGKCHFSLSVAQCSCSSHCRKIHAAVVVMHVRLESEPVLSLFPNNAWSLFFDHRVIHKENVDVGHRRVLQATRKGI